MQTDLSNHSCNTNVLRDILPISRLLILSDYKWLFSSLAIPRRSSFLRVWAVGERCYFLLWVLDHAGLSCKLFFTYSTAHGQK